MDKIMDESRVPQKTTTVTLNVEKLKKTEKKLFSDQDRTTSTTQNFTKKIAFFCININKNAKEKLSLGFWVTKLTLLELVFQTAVAIKYEYEYGLKYVYWI